LLPLREHIALIPLRFASLGLFLELLQFLSLLGARISIPFRALLAIVRPECHVISLFRFRTTIGIELGQPKPSFGAGFEKTVTVTANRN
jgi:hypothetical protein